LISQLPNALDLPAEWSGLGRYLVAHDYRSRRTNVVKAPEHIWDGCDEVCNRGSQRTRVKFGETVVYPGDWLKSYSVNADYAYVLLPDLTWAGIPAGMLARAVSRRDILRNTCNYLSHWGWPTELSRAADAWLQILGGDNGPIRDDILLREGVPSQLIRYNGQ